MNDRNDQQNAPSASLSQCPRCSSHRLVGGAIPAAEGNNPAFHPNAQRFGALRLGVELSRDWQACIECGFVFGQVSPVELIDQLARFATPEVKRWLSERPETPI